MSLDRKKCHQEYFQSVFAWVSESWTFPCVIILQHCFIILVLYSIIIGSCHPQVLLHIYCVSLSTPGDDKLWQSYLKVLDYEFDAARLPILGVWRWQFSQPVCWPLHLPHNLFIILLTLLTVCLQPSWHSLQHVCSPLDSTYSLLAVLTILSLSAVLLTVLSLLAVLLTVLTLSAVLLTV